MTPFHWLPQLAVPARSVPTRLPWISVPLLAPFTSIPLVMEPPIQLPSLAPLPPIWQLFGPL